MVSIGLVSIFVVLISILFTEIALFIIALVATFFFTYYQSKLELGFDITPALPLMILFSMKLGFGYGVIFIIFGSVLPGLVSGGINHTTFIFLGLAITISYIASLSLIENNVIYGIGLIFAQALAGFLISRIFPEDPVIIFSVILGLVLNIIYFLIFSRLFL